MEEKIKKELIELEEELLKFKKLSEQINDVKNFSKETIESVGDMQKKVNQHLEMVVNYYEKYLLQTKTIFEEDVGELINSNNEIITDQKSILEQTRNIIENNIELIKKMEKIDFPSRLDKIDVSVSSINQGNLNILMKLENMEKSIKEDLLKKNKKIFEKLKKQSESIKYIKIGMVLIILGILASIFLK